VIFRKAISLSFLFIVLFSLSFCKKPDQTVNLTRVIVIDNGIAIYDLLTINDSTILAVGGKRNVNGEIFLSEDRGQTWLKTWESPFCIYTVYERHDSVIFAGGDSITLLKSVDNGKSWQSIINYPFSDWQSFVTPIQSICFINSDTGFIVGGDNQNKGIYGFTGNGGMDWKFRNFSNEFHSVIFDTTKTGYIVGYGKVLRTNNNGVDWQEAQFSGDNLKSAIIQNQVVWACGYRGNIYCNESGQWHPVFDVSAWNNHVRWCDIINTKNNNLLAVGNNGLLWLNRSGTLMELADAPDLLSVTEIDSNVFYAGTNDGRIYVFSLY